MTSGEFFKSLLNRNGVAQSKGDGRELFAYRCTNVEYQALCEMAKTGVIKRLLDGVQNDDIYAPALLCLFAAERLWRHHDGGTFEWEDALGITPKSVQKTYEVITRGLSGWGRSIKKASNKTERYQYIYTLACEGGLPLKLLQTPKVREYFKALQGIRVRRNSPICADQARDGLCTYTCRR